MTNQILNTSETRNQQIQLNSILEAIGRFMNINSNDEFMADIIIAAAISVNTEDPIWMMITASPSSGKTQLLKLIERTDNYHFISNITNRFLFSGHPVAQGGYMIRKVGEKGLLAFPDFTTVLSMNSAARNDVFNQLRVIYDGEAGLGTGIDIGEAHKWVGKVSIVACVTESIEKHKNSGNDLGERFLYYYFSPDQNIDIDTYAERNNNELIHSTKDQIKHFVEQTSSVLANYSITDGTKTTLLNYAKFIGRVRAAVDRDNYSREIRHVHTPEMPHRVMKALLNLYKILLAMNRGETDRPNRIIKAVTLSTITDLKRKIIMAVKQSRVPVSLDDISPIVDLSKTTVRRAIEDLVAQKVLVNAPGHSNQEHKYIFQHEFTQIVNEF